MPLTADQVTVQNLPSGKGVRIFVDDRETDSLAVIEVVSRERTLSLRGGLRGNYTARFRPMRWISTYMEALPVSESERAQRRANYLRRMGR